MRRTVYVLIGLIVLSFLGSAAVGVMLSGGILQPLVRPLTPELVQSSAGDFQKVGASREDFVVNALDGTVLRGWKVYAGQANGGWVLLSASRITAAGP